MQGPLGSMRSAALVLLAWLILGLALGGLLAAAGAGWAASLLFAVPLTLVYGSATGYSAYYLCRARPLSRHRPLPLALLFGFAATCAAALWTAAGVGWNALGRTLAPGWAGLPAALPFAVPMFGLGLVLYGLWVVASYLAIEAARARELEMRELRTLLAAHEAELRVLRTQVDPHFLFNSLNSISALTAIDPARARDMTLELAGFFRHTLALEGQERVTLEAEMELVRRFLAIERVRFGERLAFEDRVQADTRACLVPPMLLQPLVENAVKHGVARMLAPGSVRVSAARAGSILRIRVDNAVDDDAPAAPGDGRGLANVRQRLSAAYAHEASANWSSSEGRFRVDLVLPAHDKEH